MTSTFSYSASWKLVASGKIIVNDIVIEPVTTQAQAKELDRILWEVLWQPIGLPRDIRETLKLEGTSIELVATRGSKVLGGLVAVWLSAETLELRHIALRPEFQRTYVGTRLVSELMAVAEAGGCLVIQTYARNTSVVFFARLGFVALSEEPLDHPDFSKHGISFLQMEYGFAG